MLGQSDMHNNLVYPLLRRFVREGLVTQKKLPVSAARLARSIRSPRSAAKHSLRASAISTTPLRVPPINSACVWDFFP